MEGDFQRTLDSRRCGPCGDVGEDFTQQNRARTLLPSAPHLAGDGGGHGYRDGAGLAFWVSMGWLGGGSCMLDDCPQIAREIGLQRPCRRSRR